MGIYFNDTTKREVEPKMVTLKEAAEAYEPPQTYNIADLDRVPVDINIEEKEGKNSDGETFRYKFTQINGKDYRVPNSVLEELQTILKLKPSVTHIRVKKTGSGLGTRYKVEEAV
jgi:hypothetical protein